MKTGRIVALFALITLAPSTSSAQVYAGLGLGPAVNMDSWPTQFVVEQQIGYSFDGHHGGFFLAFEPWQSWGADFWCLAFPLGIGGVFNVFQNRDVTFQVGPSGQIGFAISDYFNSPQDVDPWFFFGFSALLRLLVLQERLAIFLRPLGFTFAFGDSPVHGNDAIRYVLMGGIQYYF